jgi:hypothetical protein
MANLNNIMAQSLTIAQQLAPFDTGNTAYNALSISRSNTGFTLRLSGAISPYGVGMDLGLEGFSPIHIGWFSNNIFNEVSANISNKGGFNFNNIKSPLSTPRRDAKLLSQLGNEGFKV